MSYIFGKKLVCDACGESVFLEKIPFAPTETYENDPEGWTHSKDFGNMCPHCTRNYGLFVSEMFGIDKVPEKWKFARY